MAGVAGGDWGESEERRQFQHVAYSAQNMKKNLTE